MIDKRIWKFLCTQYITLCVCVWWKKAMQMPTRKMSVSSTPSSSSPFKRPWDFLWSKSSWECFFRTPSQLPPTMMWSLLETAPGCPPDAPRMPPDALGLGWSDIELLLLFYVVSSRFFLYLTWLNMCQLKPGIRTLSTRCWILLDKLPTKTELKMRWLVTLGGSNWGLWWTRKIERFKRTSWRCHWSLDSFLPRFYSCHVWISWIKKIWAKEKTTRM